jgi:hypothetical protein
LGLVGKRHGRWNVVHGSRADPVSNIHDTCIGAVHFAAGLDADFSCMRDRSIELIPEVIDEALISPNLGLSLVRGNQCLKVRGQMVIETDGEAHSSRSKTLRTWLCPQFWHRNSSLSGCCGEGIGDILADLEL